MLSEIVSRMCSLLIDKFTGGGWSGWRRPRGGISPTCSSWPNSRRSTTPCTAAADLDDVVKNTIDNEDADDPVVTTMGKRKFVEELEALGIR